MRSENPNFGLADEYLRGKGNFFPSRRQERQLPLTDEQTLTLAIDSGVPITYYSVHNVIWNYDRSGNIEGMDRLHRIGEGPELLIETTKFIFRYHLEVNNSLRDAGLPFKSPLELLKEILDKDTIDRITKSSTPDGYEIVTELVNETSSNKGLRQAVKELYGYETPERPRRSMRDLVTLGKLGEEEEQKIEDWLIEAIPNVTQSQTIRDTRTA